MSSAAGGSSSFAYFGMDFTYAYNDIIWGEGIARDSEGNYIVVGRVWTSTRYGYIVKLDPNGNTLASYLVDASSKYGEVLDVCVDSSDNIYILLRMQGNNSQVPTIAKLNSSFTLQWIKSYDNSGWGMDSYRGNWGAITTDGTDVYATCALSVSGVGAGGMYLRASCSNGTASALKHFRNSGVVQQYQCNICIDSNNDYVVITGHNETWGDGVAVIVDLSTNAIKSNGVYRLDSSFGYDGFTANADPDDSGNVFIAGHWYDTGTSTRWLSVAKLDPSAATPLQFQYNWAPFTGSSSGALRVRPMATNNSNGDVILWALSHCFFKPKRPKCILWGLRRRRPSHHRTSPSIFGFNSDCNLKHLKNSTAKAVNLLKINAKGQAGNKSDIFVFWAPKSNSNRK